MFTSQCGQTWINRVRHLGPETIDKIICAEIPNEYKKQENENKEQPRTKNPLHEAVTSFMMHGPCNPKMACTKKGYCQYGYPKEYSPETMMSEDRYPVYRRRAPEEGGNSYFAQRTGKLVTYTNANNVPYNKCLFCQ